MNNSIKTADLSIVDETLDEVDYTGLVPGEEDILGDVLSTGQSQWSGAPSLDNESKISRLASLLSPGLTFLLT